MQHENYHSQEPFEDQRISDLEIARIAAEAEWPLRESIHQGKDILAQDPSQQRAMEAWANRIGEEAATRAFRTQTRAGEHTAETLDRLHSLISGPNRELLQESGALGVLESYALHLKKALPEDSQGSH